MDVNNAGPLELLLEGRSFLRSATPSPDGQWLAYTSTQSGRTEIFVSPYSTVASGDQWQVSSDAGMDPAWSPDGRVLFFWQAGKGLLAAQVETQSTFRSRSPTVLFDTAAFDFGGGDRQYDVAPDGKRFLVKKPIGPGTGDGSQPVVVFVEHWFRELTERVPVP